MVEISGNLDRDVGNEASDEDDSVNSSIDAGDDNRLVGRAATLPLSEDGDPGDLPGGTAIGLGRPRRGPVKGSQRRPENGGFQRSLRQQIIHGGPEGVGLTGVAANAWRHAWRSECESVYPLLKHRRGGEDRSAATSVSKEWRDRISVLRTYAGNVRRWASTSPDVDQGSSLRRKGFGTAGRAGVRGMQLMTRLVRHLHDDMERILAR